MTTLMIMKMMMVVLNDDNEHGGDSSDNDDDSSDNIAFCVSLIYDCILYVLYMQENCRLFNNKVSTVAVCFPQDHIGVTNSSACVRPLVPQQSVNHR